MEEVQMAEDAAPEGAGGIETDFSGRMSYGDYLGLDLLLAAQKPEALPYARGAG